MILNQNKPSKFNFPTEMVVIVMHIFYNETFDFRIVIKTEDYHIACEKLREYINDKEFGVHTLTINDFTYEQVDVIL